MKAKILESSVEFIHRPFIKPLKLSSGPITQITEAQVSVRVRVDAKEAVGRGAIYLSDLWAWPDPALAHEVRDGHLRNLSQTIASGLADLCGAEAHHPLELGLRLHQSVCQIDSPVATVLARATCASP